MIIYGNEQGELMYAPVAAYLEKYSDSTVVWDAVSTRIGWAVVFCGKEGVVAVRLARDVSIAVAEILKESNRIGLIRVGGEGSPIMPVMELVAGMVEGIDSDVLLPLDVQGTEFQCDVWEVVRGIPKGATMTYGDVAKEMGSPDAARAVGSACAANSIALVIPCHRVIPSGDSAGVSGYRWGWEAKRHLLDAEGAFSSKVTA